MRTPPGTRADYRWFLPMPTRWMDNDIYGHMNNVQHYSFFDTLVARFLLAHGVLDLGHSEHVGLVVETGCRYFAEMAFPDVVHAGIRVARLGGSSVRYEVGLFRNDEQTAAAEGYFIHVQVDRATRRPVGLDQEMRSMLSPLVVD